MKPNVLFLNVEFPLPTDNGGKIGVMGCIEALSNISNLTVLTFGEGNFQPRLAELRKMFPAIDDVRVVPHKIHMRRDRGALFGVALKMVMQNLPYFAAKFVSPEMSATLADLLKNKHYDHIIVCHDTRLGAYLPILRRQAPNAAVESIVIDIEANVLADFIKQPHAPLVKSLAQIERNRCARFENQLRDALDHVLCLSMSDMEQIARENPRRSVSYMPTAVKPISPATDTSTPQQAKDHTVLMVSNFAWQPNAEAAQWMLKEVAPHLWKLRDKTEIILAGKGSIEIAADNKNPLVKGLGFVDDLEKLYRESSVVAVPVLSTSGIRIKLLDAMAAALPIVSTAMAAKAIGAVHGEHVLATDDPQQFAEQIVALSENQDLANRLRHNAVALIRDKHSIAEVEREFQRCFDIVSQRRKHDPVGT